MKSIVWQVSVLATQNSGAGRPLEVLKRNVALLAFPPGRLTLQTSRSYIYSCPLRVEGEKVKFSLFWPYLPLFVAVRGCDLCCVAPGPHARVWHAEGRIHKPSTHSFNDHLLGLCDRHQDSGQDMFPVLGSWQPNGATAARVAQGEHSEGPLRVLQTQKGVVRAPEVRAHSRVSQVKKAEGWRGWPLVINVHIAGPRSPNRWRAGRSLKEWPCHCVRVRLQGRCPWGAGT